MADDSELLDRHWPLLDEDVEHLGEGATVSRDMQPGVVVKIERRVVEVASQSGAVIVPLPVPVSFVEAQAVHQDREPAAGLGDLGRDRPSFELQRHPVRPQPHGNRQRIAGLDEVIAHDAVQRRQHSAARARRFRIAEHRAELRQSRIHPTACPSRKSHPGRIRAMKQNQRIIRRDACVLSPACDVCRQPVSLAAPA